MEDSVAKHGETLEEEQKKVIHDLIRWLVFVPLILLLLLACGQVAGLGLNTPVGETRSNIYVDYAVWTTQPYHPPLAAAIIEEIRREENLPAELVVTGAYWPTITPRPGAAVPSATEVALQPSPSPSPSKSATSLPQSTATPEKPTLPATRTSTITPTSSATASPTPTFTRTYIPGPLWTRTPTQEPPDTAIPSATPSGTSVPTFTATSTRTAVATPTPSSPPSSTGTRTPTVTLTPLSSLTLTPSPTYTPTPTFTPGSTASPSSTPTPTNTSSPSQTPTQTSTSTRTPTPTYTLPPTQLATPTATATRVAISGVLEGSVVANPDSSCTAYWGYDNPNAYSVVIDIGPANQFSPLPADRGQPILFISGRQVAVFQTTWFGGGDLVWALDGGSATAGWCQSSPTDTPTPTATPTPIPTPSGINIGPGDGQILDISCGNSVILDLGAPYPIGSMVFYEYENPPWGQQILLDWIYLSVSNDAAGPWVNVFYWGDSVNGNNGSLPQYPPAPTPGQHYPPETDNEVFIFSELYMGSTAGIQIPVYGTYRYILIGAPPGCGDAAQIDSIQFVP